MCRKRELPWSSGGAQLHPLLEFDSPSAPAVRAPSSHLMGCLGNQLLPAPTRHHQHSHREPSSPGKGISPQHLRGCRMVAGHGVATASGGVGCDVVLGEKWEHERMRRISGTSIGDAHVTTQSAITRFLRCWVSHLNCVVPVVTVVRFVGMMRRGLPANRDKNSLELGQCIWAVGGEPACGCTDVCKAPQTDLHLCHVRQVRRRSRGCIQPILAVSRQSSVPSTPV